MYFNGYLLCIDKFHIRVNSGFYIFVCRGISFQKAFCLVYLLFCRCLELCIADIPTIAGLGIDMRYLLILRISDASCNLSYRGRNIQHRMCGRTIAYNVGASYLIENISTLKASRGVEIDFTGLAAGHTYRKSVYLLLVAVVTLTTCGADYLYLVGCQFA